MSSSKNEMSSINEAQCDDELPPLNLVTFVRRHFLVLVGGTILGGALGLAVAFVLPPQWESVALLQVAQLGGATPVESPLRAVERVMQQSFIEDTRKRMGISPDESNLEKSLLCSSVKAKIEKTDLVSVRVRGSSLDETARCADAMVAELATAHTKMAEPTIQRWRSELEDIDMELKRGAGEFAWVKGLIEKPTNAPAVTSLYQISLASNILVFRGTQMRELRERKRVLQEQLSPERTFPTALFGRVKLLKQPVFPKKPHFAVGGLGVGLLMVVLLSVFRHASARRNIKIKTD